MARFARGMGIRDIAEVEQISIGKVLYSLVKLKLSPQARQTHYDELEIVGPTGTSFGVM